MNKENASSFGADPDRRLVERARQGEKAAFDFLVLKYEERLRSAVSSYANDPADALDILQETFFRAHRALAGFRGESAFYTWLYRIAINTARNHVSSCRWYSYSRPETAIGAEGEEVDRRLRNEATPDAYLEEKQAEEVVTRALGELPESLRTTLTLRELKGLTYKQIADVTGSPVGTVRSRISRARLALDKRLQLSLHP